MPEIRTYCRICLAHCGVIVTVDEDQPEPAVLHVRGDSEHPVSQGYTCPKGRALPGLHHHPHRLEHPLMRRGTGAALERVGWDDLLDDLGARVADVLAQTGPNGVAFYFATGAALDANGRAIGERLMRRIGSRQKYTSLTIDSPGKPVVTELVGGWPWLNPTWDEERCPLLLLVGINPVVSHGHTNAMSNPRTRLRTQAQRGELWVIDPRVTESARLATGHLAVRPGSDAILLAFLVRGLLDDGADREFVAAHTTGVERLAEAVAPCDLSRTAAVTGVPEQQLLDLLTAVRRAGRLAVLTGTGVSMSAAANAVEWMKWALLAVTGSCDRPGGMWFNPGYLLQLDTKNLPVSPPEGTWEPGPASRPEVLLRYGEIPCSALVSEIEAGNIRALVVVGGNVVRTFPDTERTTRALGSLEALAVLDIVDTETTALATHVLPCTGQLERADMPVLLDAFQDQVMSQRTAAVVPPVAERRHAWWSLAKLGERLGLSVLPGDRLADETTDDDLLDGVVRRSRHPERLASAPVVVVDESAVFGWVTDRVLPDGRWRLAPEALVADLETALARVPADLVLTPRRLLRAMNSQLRDVSSDRDGAPEADVLVNPADATAAGIADGDAVRVVGTHGSTEGRARVSDEIRVGVVSVPHGWGEPDVCRLTTSAEHVDPLSGMVLLSGVPVRLEPVAAG